MDETAQIRIAFVGDIFPGELPFTLNYGIRTQFEKHKGEPWVNRVKDIIGTNDITIGNLEAPLVDREKALKPIFYGSPDFAGFLKECGINVLNVANNHILEQGDQGFLKTIESLEGAGLGVVGNVANHQSRVLIREVKGVRVAIAGFSNVDLHKIENNNRFAVLSEENVLSTLNLMKQQKADIKILSLHWGDEYVHIPSPEQKTLAYKFIDAGADIIAGHHPHVIQPYEKYKNGHIFYSLGNFMFDYLQSKKVRKGLIAAVEILDQKRIGVVFSGVELSGNDLVASLNEKKFFVYFSNINNNYQCQMNQNDSNYTKNYKKKQKKSRLVERILMKTKLIMLWFSFDSSKKTILFKNILSYYLKKSNGF